jgi:hypothetical protein
MTQRHASARLRRTSDSTWSSTGANFPVPRNWQWKLAGRGNPASAPMARSAIAAR